MSEKMLCRLLSPPLCLTDQISVSKWQEMSDEKQDELVDTAKDFYNLNPEYNFWTVLNHKKP